jgi:predicted XRE-type DNA-binding protein
MPKNTTTNTTKTDGRERPPRSAGKRARVIDSSGDVFADLGIHLDERERLKVDIAHEITNIIVKSGLSQAEIAKVIGADQAKVSNLTRGRLKGFSLERLVYYLLCLGYDVDVHISHQRRVRADKGEVRVHAIAG